MWVQKVQDHLEKHVLKLYAFLADGLEEISGYSLIYARTSQVKER